MTDSRRGPLSSSRVLATDLDGTLIPLAGCESNVSDLATLAERLRAAEVTLVFVTGRHFNSVSGAIEEHRLPQPDWIICDVGTTIYHRRRVDEPRADQRSADEFVQLQAYGEHLAELTVDVSLHELRTRLAVFDSLREQEPEKQGRFKLSYYANADELNELQAMLGKLLDEWSAPYSLIHSVDPFNGDGLIDLLPQGVSKAYALSWWSQHVGISHEAVVYAGDSGNDLAAFTAGYRTIVVGNAARSLCEQVRDSHEQAGWHDRLFVAQAHATSGVLAGCKMFGLIDKE